MFIQQPLSWGPVVGVRVKRRGALFREVRATSKEMWKGGTWGMQRVAVWERRGRGSSGGTTNIFLLEK